MKNSSDACNVRSAESAVNSSCALMVTERNHHCGTKLMSGPSPRTSTLRLSVGEGEASRKAGLIECSESLLLLLLKGGQGSTAAWWASCREQPEESEGTAVAGALETSWTRGVVFGVPEGHRP